MKYFVQWLSYTRFEDFQVFYFSIIFIKNVNKNENLVILISSFGLDEPIEDLYLIYEIFIFDL